MPPSAAAAPSSTLVPFLVLPENRFAFEAVSAIGRKSTVPVYLYGPSGAGKSHLARHGVRLFLSRRPRARVQHLTAAEFAAELSEASAHRAIPLFQAALRELDLFVLEDLAALAGRGETQQQLLAVYDELVASDCQVVWTSRAAPGELGDFPRKLVSRFRAGVTAQLRLPGSESRARLFSHFAQARQMALSAEPARLLAEGLAVSPRELWAALGQIEAFARHERKPIDADLARRFLNHDVRSPRLRLEEVCRAVARQFGVSPSLLRSRRRSRGILRPRQCAMLLAHRHTGQSLQQIGAYFGGRKHSTVIHACHRLGELVLRDPQLQLQLSQIEAALGVS